MADAIKPVEVAPTATEHSEKVPETEKSVVEAPAPKPVETAEAKTETSAVDSTPAAPATPQTFLDSKAGSGNETGVTPVAPVVGASVDTITTKTDETPATTTADAPTAEAGTVPTKDAPKALTNEQWGSISNGLLALYAKLPTMISLSGDYNEIFGVTLRPAGAGDTAADFSTLLILQKFLRANADSVEKAEDQLVKTLQWRNVNKPLESLASTHDEERFKGLGYVQTLPGGEILTWNIYGAVTDYKKTFADVEGFLKWRVSLMEAAIAKLNLSTATTPIPDYGKGADPYQLIQIHDYLNVSFFRLDPHAKTASKYTIEIFRDFYPEMLSRKFFVNVPVVMGWVFTAMKLVLPKTTIAKFQVYSYGNQLVNDLGEGVPAVYGGKGPALDELESSVRLGKPGTA